MKKIMAKDRKARGRRRNGTQTSAFGSPGRFGHDSTKFYQTRLYDGLDVNQPVEYLENEVPSHVLDTVFCKSSELMDEVPDNSIHLMVTSPPYNVTKEYDEDLSLEDYRNLLKRVFAETYKKLVTGGRACINIANLGRRPYIPLHSYIIADMQEIGYLMRGEIIWDKGASASSSTAWGSWRSALNPVLRDVHEYILVFSKESFGRKKKADNVSTITRDQFLEYTKSVWNFPAESARRVGHPAPFPVELPHRLAQLYTLQDEVVLDPFVGSGSTCLAAIKAGRRYIGYDTNAEYVSLAEKRINAYRVEQAAAIAKKKMNLLD
ncbi:MAG: site-specific DNA-methyltransferase [Dehalococcoidia bacterium]|nr:site-specific DNA-methyltransferase [Dehalococcoidia bacterium]